MTKEEVSKYSEICGELDDINYEIAQAEAAKTLWVLPCDYIARSSELACNKIKVEAYVKCLPWKQRRLAKAVMKYGPRWDVVRRELHSSKSPDALRMEYNRIFENKL